MKASRKLVPVVIGVRVKSGWGSAVVIGGSAKAPVYLHRRRVELSDPDVPHSAQPYHAAFATLQKDAAVLRRLTQVAHRAAERSMRSLLKECRALGCAPRAVALVVGSTALPETITNEHIRAHTCESQLFRMTLERAARRLRLPCSVVRERDLTEAAVQSLRITPGALRLASIELGRAAGKPWRGEEKTAAVAAWTMLG